MKQVQEYLTYDEIEIGIGRILKLCKKRIKWILLFSIVVAIAYSLYSYNKDVEAAREQNLYQQGIVLTSEDYKIVEKYHFLKSKVDAWESYREKSPVLKLNCNNVYTSNILYYIDAEDDLTRDVGETLVEYIDGVAFKNVFAQNAEVNYSDYADELYEANIIGDTGRVINIEVLAASEEDAIKYEEVIDEALKGYSNQLKEIIGNHEIVVLQKNREFGFSEKLCDLQEQYYKDVEVDTAIFSNYTSGFSWLSWYYIALAEGNTEVVESTISVPKFEIKNMVIGLCLGITLCVVLIAVVMIFDGKLQSEQELKKRFDILKFGSINRKSSEEQLAVIVTCASQMVKNLNADKVCIVSTSVDLEEKRLNDLYIMLKDTGISCEIIGNLVDNKEALAKMSKTKPVILIEEVGKSKVKEIYAEVSICNELSKEILGYICITE